MDQVEVVIFPPKLEMKTTCYARYAKTGRRAPKNRARRCGYKLGPNDFTLVSLHTSVPWSASVNTCIPFASCTCLPL